MASTKQKQNESRQARMQGMKLVRQVKAEEFVPHERDPNWYEKRMTQLAVERAKPLPHPQAMMIGVFAKQAANFGEFAKRALLLKADETVEVMFGRFPVKLTLADAPYFARLAFEMARNSVNLERVGWAPMGGFHEQWLASIGNHTVVTQ